VVERDIKRRQVVRINALDLLHRLHMDTLPTKCPHAVTTGATMQNSGDACNWSPTALLVVSLHSVHMDEEQTAATDPAQALAGQVTRNFLHKHPPTRLTRHHR
jgi:hypothetical protein